MSKVQLTLAQAEVANALYALISHQHDLPQIEPREVFPNRDNAHNGARRTFSGLVKAGLIETMPAGHFPRYRVTRALFDALSEWRFKNDQAVNPLELRCY